MTLILSVPVGTGGGGAAIVVVADGRGAGVVMHYNCRESAAVEPDSRLIVV
jgi:hypothetical protein